MFQAFTARLPIHKATNSASVIEVGDTVTLVIKNDAGVATGQDVVVTAVLDYGKTIQWNASTTGNLGTRHIIRVHRKHEYHCAGADTWEAVLTEDNSPAVAQAVTSLTINGIVYPIGIAEVGVTNGLEESFTDAVIAKLNEMLGGNGVATGVVAGVAGTQTFTIRITSTTHVPSTWVLVGLTAAAWTNP